MSEKHVTIQEQAAKVVEAKLPKPMVRHFVRCNGDDAHGNTCGWESTRTPMSRSAEIEYQAHALKTHATVVTVHVKREYTEVPVSK